MRKVIRITGVEHKVSKLGRPYDITHVMVDDGQDAQFYGTDVKVGDEVEIFLDDHYGTIKAQKRFTKFIKHGDNLLDD